MLIILMVFVISFRLCWKNTDQKFRCFKKINYQSSSALTLVKKNGLLHLSVTPKCNFDSYERYDDSKD